MYAQLLAAGVTMLTLIYFCLLYTSRASYPAYFMAKNRVDLTPETDVDAILAKVKELYKNEEINDICLLYTSRCV